MGHCSGCVRRLVSHDAGRWWWSCGRDVIDMQARPTGPVSPARSLIIASDSATARLTGTARRGPTRRRVCDAAEAASLVVISSWSSSALNSSAYITHRPRPALPSPHSNQRYPRSTTLPIGDSQRTKSGGFQAVQVQWQFDCLLYITLFTVNGKKNRRKKIVQTVPDCKLILARVPLTL